MLTRWLRLGVAAGLALLPAAASAAHADSAIQSEVTGGRLKLVTYNIAALPEGLSNSRPSVNVPVIGSLLNQYDLVMVQEDFAYPFALRREIRHPHGSPPFIRGERLDFGDGLSQFSRQPFSDYTRETWSDCHGVFDAYFDCLTPKGFTFSRQQLSAGVVIDVYNLHMDAGSSRHDRRARAAQIDQLAAAVLKRSVGRPVIVAGDFNLTSAELERLAWLDRVTGLRDVCKQLRCPEPWRIDRVLFRGSEGVELTPRVWRVDRRFVDSRRRPLSDHLAVAVELEWTAAASDPRASATDERPMSTHASR